MTCGYRFQAPLTVIYRFFENILSFTFRDSSNKIFGHGAVTVVTAILSYILVQIRTWWSSRTSHGRGVSSNVAKFCRRLHNLCKITPGLRRDYTQVFSRLLKNTDMCWQKPRLQIKNYKRLHRYYRTSVRDYSHVADPPAMVKTKMEFWTLIDSKYLLLAGLHHEWI